MTVIQGTITDVGGDDPTGWLNIAAVAPRPSEDGTATVGTALYPVRVSAGVITPTDIEPGPVVIQVTVGTWNHRYELVWVPDQVDPVDFWELVQNTATFEPWVIPVVHADRIAAEAAAAEAVAAAESVSDISAQVAAVDADRVAAETAASNAATSETNAAASASTAGTHESDAALSALAAGDSETAAGTSETNAAASEAAAAAAQTAAETAETNAGASATAAATSESNAATSAADAAQSAQDAADTVASGVPNADATTKGGILLAGDLAGTWDAVTVPELADKAELVHTHAISSVVGLQTALDDKADLIGGFIPTSQIPAVALSQRTVVADRAAMLALSAQEGDVAVVSTPGDPDKGTYMLGSGDPTVFSSWTLLVAPDDVVSSVNGQNGAVVLDASDVGAAPTSHSHAISDVTGLQAELDLRLEGEVVDTLPGTPVTGRIYFIRE